MSYVVVCISEERFMFFCISQHLSPYLRLATEHTVSHNVYFYEKFVTSECFVMKKWMVDIWTFKAALFLSRILCILLGRNYHVLTCDIILTVSDLGLNCQLLYQKFVLRSCGSFLLCQKIACYLHTCSVSNDKTPGSTRRHLETW